MRQSIIMIIFIHICIAIIFMDFMIIFQIIIAFLLKQLRNACPYLKFARLFMETREFEKHVKSVYIY